jgi:hypothetical protein
MPRFNGVPVGDPELSGWEDGSGKAVTATAGKPRFNGVPVAPSGKHLSFEEGQQLLERDRLSGTEGEIGAGLSGFIDGIPIVGPAILSGAQKAAAGISSMIDGEDYGTNLKQAQQITQTAQEQNPIASTAGEIAGGIAGTAPLVAAAPAAFGIGAASVPARMLAGAATGGAIGGADGYVRNGAEGALWGGGVGMAAGAAGPLIGDVAGRAYRSVSNRSAQNEAARLAGTNRPAVDVVARALASDNAVGASNANIAAAGPQGMLADAGPSTLSVLDTAIARGGPNSGAASKRISDRLSAESQKFNGVLDAEMGRPGESLSRDLIIYGDKTNPMTLLYKKAYASPIDYADPRAMEIERLVKTRVPESAIKAANDLMRTEGVESAQILAKVADDGTVSLERLPDVRQLDYITRGLNQVAQEADGKGALGGTTPIGRAYGNLAGEIRSRLKVLVPDYETALDRAGTEIGKVKAEKFGTNLLSDGVTRSDVKEFADGITVAERNKLTQAIRLDIDDRIAKVKAAFSDPNLDAREAANGLKLLSGRANREKVALAIGQDRANRIFDSLDTTIKSFQLRAGVATNSRTYARQAAERAVGQATAPSFAEQAGKGKPLASAQSFLQTLLNTGEASQLARQDQTWGEIANLLTRPASQGGGTFLQAMQRAAQQIPTTDRRAQSIADAVTRGAVLSSPAARRQAQN